MVKRFVIESTHGYPVFRVVGDVDFSAQAEFEAALRGMDVSGASAAIVSFEDCTFFDSSIVGALMKYWRLPERTWDAVLVIKPENPANRVFEIVGIDRVYPIAHSLDEAAARAVTLAAARSGNPATSG
jgi:anti-anti-sigma factor